MLHKCANPDCSHPFRRLSEGKLFLVESRPKVEPEAKRWASRRIEHYWLCGECAPLLTLCYQQGRGIVAVPLPELRKTSEIRVLLPKLPDSETLQSEADAMKA